MISLRFGRTALAALTASALAATLALASLPVKAQAIRALRASANYRLGKDANPVRARETPGLAVHPSNPRHIVEVDLDVRNEECTYRTSFDGGRTWRGGRLRVPRGFEQPPCYPLDIQNHPPIWGSVVFGSRQDVYTTFSTERRDGGTSTMVARSSDGGRTFKTAVEALAGPPEAGSGYNRPWVAVVRRRAGDTIYVFAMRQKDNPDSPFPITQALVVARSTNRGETFGAPVEVSAPGEAGVGQTGRPGVGPDGTLYIPWRGGGFFAPVGALRVARSTDGGNTWSQKTLAQLRGLKQPIEMAVHQATGAVYMVYQANVLGDNDVFLVRSTDRGATWSDPIRVNDDPRGNGVGQITPSVSVAPGGRVDVTWNDQRHRYPQAGPTAHGLPAAVPGEDVYYAYSTDGGQSFSRNRRLTDRTINRDVGVRIELAANYPPRSVPLGRNRILVAWGDSREGNVDNDNQDVYLTQLSLQASGPVPVASLSTSNIIDMSVALSRYAYPGGSEERTYERLTKVVIANQSDSAGALAAGVLARANAAPVLLSGRSGLARTVRREISRLAPAGAFLIGSKSLLSNRVVNQLRGLGIAGSKVVRISGTSPADRARAIAAATPVISPASSDPPFKAAVIVNPAGPSASTAAGLAAASPYPVLFVAARSIPSETQRALNELKIPRTFVIGDAGEVGEDVVAQLPQPTRLSGRTMVETSTAVARESLAQGFPENLAYLGDANKRMLSILLGVAAARRGGITLLAPTPTRDTARRALRRLALAGAVDRVVIARLAPKARPRKSVGRRKKGI